MEHAKMETKTIQDVIINGVALSEKHGLDKENVEALLIELMGTLTLSGLSMGTEGVTKKIKEVPADANRCEADTGRRGDGGRCTHPKKNGTNYCGMHKNRNGNEKRCDKIVKDRNGVEGPCGVLIKGIGNRCDKHPDTGSENGSGSEKNQCLGKTNTGSQCKKMLSNKNYCHLHVNQDPKNVGGESEAESEASESVEEKIEKKCKVVGKSGNACGKPLKTDGKCPISIHNK